MSDSKIIHELQDMRYLEWSRIRKSSGTAGSYLKAYEEREGKKIYYKLSCYDSINGITGHESVNEIIVDRLLSIIGVEHLEYQLIHALVHIDGKEYDTYICASNDFKKKGDSKIALDDYYDLCKEPGEDILNFCKRQGWMKYIYEMLVVDYLILNRDRHGANIEIIKSKGSRNIHPAPLFDHGISLIYSCKTDSEAKAFKPLDDKPVQCYVGSRSALDNLSLIPKSKLPRFKKLAKEDKKAIFEGLEGIMSKAFIDKIWEMIWKRWQVYESLQDNR